MAGDWQPANAIERGLLDAVQRQDQHGYLSLLSSAPLLVLVEQDDTGRTVGWLTSTVDSHTYLLGYTSPESLALVAGDRDAPYLTATVEDLAHRWPEPTWWLAVNSGLPVEGLVSPAYLLSLTEQLTLEDMTAVSPAPVGTDVVAPTASLPEQRAGQPRRPPAAGAPRTADETETKPRPAARFEPVNDVEREMLAATRRGDTDSYLRALVLAEVLVPVTDRAAARNGPTTGWRTVEAYGEPSIPLFTSRRRLAERLGDVPFRTEGALDVIRRWPDPTLTLAVNPDTAVGATLPGPRVLELAQWAVQVGLIDSVDIDSGDIDSRDIDPGVIDTAEVEPADIEPVGIEPPNVEPADIEPADIEPADIDADDIGAVDTEAEAAVVGIEEVPAESAVVDEAPAEDAAPDPHLDWLQKVLPHDHVAFYRQRRYHMVSGHIHRVRDVGQVTPAELYQALGLDGPDSGFGPKDPHVHVIRWPAHGDGRYGDPERPVMEGEVPQGRVVAVPLPHGALLCRIDRSAGMTVVATYDADHREWRTATGEEHG